MKLLKYADHNASKLLYLLLILCILLPAVTPAPLHVSAATPLEVQAAAYTIPGVDRIWVIDDGVKVLRDDLNHPAASGKDNPVWDGETIRLFGARNEVVAFQVILQSGDGGAEQVNLEVSDLVNGDARIPGSSQSPEDPYDYLGRYVDLFSEHYLHITERSTGGNAWTTPARPRTDYLGWVPDALIPFGAEQGKGGAPFGIEPDRNQAVWIDIWIPRYTAPGTYTGAVRVASRGGETEIPLELKVFGFSLPDDSNIPNMFGLAPASIVRRYDLQVDTNAYYEIEARYHQMAHRHRFDLVRDVSSLSKMKEFHLRYLDGSLYTPEFFYDGPGAGAGNRTYSIGLYGMVPVEYGGSWEGTSQERWWAGSDAWALWFEQYAPHVSISKYAFPDEPETRSDFRKIRRQGEWTRSNPGPGAEIPLYVTYPVDENLTDYVDFWSTAGAWSHPGLSPGTDTGLLQVELDAGKQWAFYNGYRPLSGAQVIDADAVEFRVIPWIMWKYEVDQYFYWLTNYWTQWSSNAKDTNVYVEPQTMEYPRMGAGTFFYPGRDVPFPSQDRGLDGPISSIRMKNWRRGAQDYEYLHLAASLGLENEIAALVDQLVPAALWEADLNRNIPWPDTGYGFELIRLELAELIASATDSSTLIIQPIEEYEETVFEAAGSRETPEEEVQASNPDSQAEEALQPIFSDMPLEHQSREAIETLFRHGYLTACDYQTVRFCPEAEVSWVDMAVISLRAQDPAFLPPATNVYLLPGLGEETFGINWLEQYYMQGYLDSYLDEFPFLQPDAGLRRMEAAGLLLQLLHGPGYLPPTAEPDLYYDVPQVWYRDALAAAYEQGLLPACMEKETTYLCPQQLLTRAEAADALFIALSRIAVLSE